MTTMLWFWVFVIPMNFFFFVAVGSWFSLFWTVSSLYYFNKEIKRLRIKRGLS
jgi:hypothetical protein